MKKPLILITVLLFSISTLISQSCKALFSFAAQNERVGFVNQSQISNAHFYWNFGDGTSSNLSNPSHDYAGNGYYLVTLYALDKVSGCSDYYEMWLTISASSTTSCFPLITDSFFVNSSGVDYLKIIDLSTSCSNYSRSYYSMGGNNLSVYHPIFNRPGCFISMVMYSNSTQGPLYGIKTTINKYDRSKNYNSCSANFEFKVLQEDSFSQLIHFKAMNKNAKKYQWILTGFGDPLRSNNDTITARYYCPNYKGLFSLYPLAILKTTGQDGCTDSLYQQISCRKMATTYVGLKEQITDLIDFKIYPNPTTGKFLLVSDKTNSIDRLRIIDALGRTVYSYNGIVDEEHDISNLQSGVYFILVSDFSGRKATKKILKE